MSAKRTVRGATGAAQYQCQHCDRPRWRSGGVAALGKHLVVDHGMVDRRYFPDVQAVDETGEPLDFDGAATDSMPAVDGLIRIRPDISRVATS